MPVSTEEKKIIMTSIAGSDHVSCFIHYVKCPVPISHHNGRGATGHHKWYDNCRDDPLPKAGVTDKRRAFSSMGPPEQSPQR